MTPTESHAVAGRWEARSIRADLPRVVVSVGTDHHPFDRLIQWIDTWAALNPEVSVLAQRGTTEAPVNVISEDLVPHDDLRQYFAMAEVVISHAGPSTVMDARMAGRLPIVVARDPELGEHVDGHQLRFAKHLGHHGLARLANTEAEFVAALSEALADPAAFTIQRERVQAPPGVVRFGAVVDEILGVETSLDLLNDGGPPS